LLGFREGHLYLYEKQGLFSIDRLNPASCLALRAIPQSEGAPNHQQNYPQPVPAPEKSLFVKAC
jgi:hypothetical protein